MREKRWRLSWVRRHADKHNGATVTTTVTKDFYSAVDAQMWRESRERDIEWKGGVWSIKLKHDDEV